jgi:DivIVA domain-containing protein
MLKPEFAVLRFGPRYDRAEVDAFVERVLAAGRGTSPVLTVKDLRGVAFRSPVFGTGYSAPDVDAFLQAAEQWMPDQPAGTRVAQQQQLPSPTFTPVRLREGYDIVQVDEFVDRLLATVNGLPVKSPVTVRELRNVSFRPVRVREGYDVDEVDQFLEQAEGWLTNR